MLKILPSAIETIRQQGETIFPFECCGFLFGNEKEGRIIDLVLPVQNSKAGDQRRRFEISPLEYLRAEQFADANGKTLLGTYHSHPNHPAIASEHDLAVAMPFFSYVIVSVYEGVAVDLKSWKLKEEEHAFIEEKVKVFEIRNPHPAVVDLF